MRRYHGDLARIQPGQPDSLLIDLGIRFIRSERIAAAFITSSSQLDAYHTGTYHTDVMCVSTVKSARRHILIMTARSPFVKVDLQSRSS